MKNVFAGLTVLFATLLLLCCLAPFIPVQYAPFLSFLSLTAPFLFIVNIAALIYCITARSKFVFLALGALITAYSLFGAFYKFGNARGNESEEGLKIMSYNTRGFDRYNFFRGENVDEGIMALVEKEAPDIICFQEFDYSKSKDFGKYPHQFINFNFPNERRVVQAIFSKFPILDKGSLDFPNTVNNAIYADILYKGDTLRVYNIHMESFRIIPSRRMLRHIASGRLYNRMTATFAMQQQQAALISSHRDSTPHRVILCSDLNNTAFSRVYRMVKGTLNDSFEEAGRSFGTTYRLKFLPFRIDAIMADPSFEVQSHRNFDIRLSDHYPLMATFRLSEMDSNNP